MKINLLRNKFGGMLIAFSLLFGATLIASTTAQAQYRNDRYGRYGNGNDVYRIAQDQGYRDGIDHGAEHARDRHRFDPEGTSHYKNATEGYRSSYGNKDAYKQAYREGFRRGYDEGFRQNSGGYGGYDRGRNSGNDPYYRNDGGNDPYYRNNDPYYRNGGSRDNGGYGNDIYRIAQEQGYRDGVDHGAEHARNRDRYNPEGTSHYKNADSGYRSEYGNKDSYRQAYREGFKRGYDEGYRGSGNNGRYGRRNSRSRAADILGGILGGRP